MPPGIMSGKARGKGMRWRAPACLTLLLALLCQPAPAAAQKVRITNLSDVDFGLVANLQSDNRRSQSICLYSSSAAGGYSVLASGSGPGSAFSLSSGLGTLPYDVEWSDQSGQTSGAAVSPNVALTGQRSSATQQFCNSGPPTSASLTIVLRAADLSQARQGSYSGALTLLIAAE